MAYGASLVTFMGATKMRNCLLISCRLNRRRPVAALVDVHRRNGHVYGKQSIQPFQIVSKKGKRKTFLFFSKIRKCDWTKKIISSFSFSNRSAAVEDVGETLVTGMVYVSNQRRLEHW